MLESVADVASEVGQEYQDGYDNMPEGWTRARSHKRWSRSPKSWRPGPTSFARSPQQRRTRSSRPGGDTRRRAGRAGVARRLSGRCR